jgi:hypothetical protein
LSSLLVKLGVIKQFVKALKKEGDYLKYISKKFTALTEAKLKEGIFTGPDIRKLLFDAIYESMMNATEKAAWQVFRDVVAKFLGNTKDPHYTNIVNTTLDEFNDLGCKMSLKLHFLHSLLEYFPKILNS